jgi:lipoate-protein ligase B
MVSQPEPVALYSCGLVAYEPALALQKQLHRARAQDQINDAIIVLQHLPVITLGASGGRDDLHVSTARLEALGVGLQETSRGGKATFHGPGQLVLYPVMKLPDRDLHAYLWRLEECVIRTLAAWGIQAGRDERHPGVWVGQQKICAIGIAVRDDVTMHGLALNANTDLTFFDLFTPCGIADRGVTSLQALLGFRIDIDKLEADLIRAFGEIFGRTILPAQEMIMI